MKDIVVKVVKHWIVLQLGLLPLVLTAQLDSLPNFRYYDKRGINVFESPKEPVDNYKGFKIRIGGGVAQGFQSLSHTNNADGKAENMLYAIRPGFNTAMANFTIDAQLVSGIRFNLAMYLSTRSHNETRLKSGYVQFDKLPFDGEFWHRLMKVITIKAGLMELNYGDAHFRRSDGGHTIYNPFIENYIVDACTTDIGAELYARKKAFFAMAGIANNMTKENADSLTAALHDRSHNQPTIYGKAGVDKSVGKWFRIRLSGSYYHSSGSALFAGDDAGSNYFMVMEKAGMGVTSASNAFSGRLDPGFANKVNAFQFNVFFKLLAFEVFATYEDASGRTKTESNLRHLQQYALDWIVRFGDNEKLFFASRYNAVTARLPEFAENVKIDRVVLSAGYFFTKNILLKAEVIDQQYINFPQEDYRHEGKFNGFMVQAVVGF